jgi:hypothetical protein
MLEAQGMAALDPRIRFGSIRLLFFGGLAVSILAVVLCAGAPAFARGLVAVAVGDLCWIWGPSFVLHATNNCVVVIASGFLG